MANTLVLYFSQTGTTKRIAEKIAKKLQADLYRIEEADSYSTKDLDWTLPDSRANLEQNDAASRPAYKGQLPDVKAYDKIIIGSPTWWGIPPRIIYTVIDHLDLADKTVATFATSGGSAYSQTQTEMNRLIGSSNLLKGRMLSRSASVDQWLKDTKLL
ncbi:flavodoxin [Streptococcus troglodytae]|uniref:Flavodoxin n=1 Tax=Streptococcus troglodytae TaxID=1111760 RepID=A0A1L7LI00_9STRE|nr:flavodoxin [Streptococcus troglodytae]BAQ23821.1 flavodoxin [Streptococcus troglodytae]